MIKIILHLGIHNICYLEPLPILATIQPFFELFCVYIFSRGFIAFFLSLSDKDPKLARGH